MAKKSSLGPLGLTVNLDIGPETLGIVYTSHTNSLQRLKPMNLLSFFGIINDYFCINALPKTSDSFPFNNLVKSEENCFSLTSVENGGKTEKTEFP